MRLHSFSFKKAGWLRNLLGLLLTVALVLISALPSGDAQAPPPGIITIAAGVNYGCALKSDGTVWAWGYNNYGELGNNSTSNSSVPVQVYGLTSVTTIAGRGSSCYALKSDGTVWAWGLNAGGELGNNSTSNSSVPVQVYGLTGVTTIAGGGGSGYALKADGTVWAWGYNNNGQLGNNSTSNSSVPVQVYGLTGVTTIAGGSASGYALKSDGTVWAWGYNNNGELGNNSTSNSSIPVQVYGLTGVTTIAGGSASGYALKADGTVWTWGWCTGGPADNYSTYSTTNSSIPVQVYGLTDVTAIVGGGASGYALKSDGTVWAWGWNDLDELGNNAAKLYCSLPVQVTGLTGVTAIAAGVASGYALKSDGTVWAWGENSDGELGNNLTGSKISVPVQISDLSATTSAFSDVPASYWAYDAIGSLSSQGYISGYPYGNFAPDALITRAEFVSIMDKALKLPAYDPVTPDFSDISGGDWYYISVKTAVHYGIAKGYGNGTFRPGYPITRQEMACVLVQALGIPSQVEANMDTKTNFTDDAGISGWARGYVVVADQNLGLLKGYPDGSFRPQSDATRAEACAMIVNFLNAQK